MNKKLVLFLLLGLLLFTPDSAFSSEIHEAAKVGNLQKVKSLIKSNAQLVNKQDEDLKTPLHHAIDLGNNEIAEYLIAQKADLNLKDKENESPLHYAASKGKFEIAKLLLEKGTTTLNDESNVQHHGYVGKWTPLHLASLKGHPEVVKLLLDHGANIEAGDEMGRTPLILCAEGQNIEVVIALVEKGADINACCKRGYPVLLWATREGFEGFVNFLIEKKVALPDGMREFALRLAARENLAKLFEYALEKGVDLAELKKRDPRLIFEACSGGSAEIVESLCRNGFPYEQADPNGWTPLHCAASEGKTEVVKYLISKGVDKNARNIMGEAAYNLALSRGFSDAAEDLKKAGAKTCDPKFPLIEGPYMGQKPPGDRPEMFLPGIVSGHNRAHSSIAFSPDGKSAYWAEMVRPEGRVAYMEIRDCRWTYPTASKVERDPSFSPDGKKLFYIKTRPFKEGEKPGGDPDVKEEYWYLEKTPSGWSEPISVGKAVNDIGVHWPCSVDNKGNLYFSEFSENMYCSHYKNGTYQEPVLLTKLLNNKTLKGRSPFISLQGDYLLFSARDGLCITYKKKDGTWTDSISLGKTINASHENGSPRVTPDGKYMFFVSAGRNRPWGIYWVAASFIGELREEHVEGE